MLRSTIQQHEGVDINNFRNVIRFLKRRAQEYKPKESPSLPKNLINDFLAKAGNNEHLLNKVVLIFGVAGGCSCRELVTLLTTSVEDSKTHILVKLHDIRTEQYRSVIILPETFGTAGSLELVRAYMALRPTNTPHKRFFLNYVRGKCTVQPVGINKIGGVPSVVAKYLGLENHSLYTGHCFRRNSATPDTTLLKRPTTPNRNE